MGESASGAWFVLLVLFQFDWRRVGAAMSYFVDHFALSKLCLYLLSMPGKKLKPVICSNSATLNAAFIKTAYNSALIFPVETRNTNGNGSAFHSKLLWMNNHKGTP